MNPVQTVLVFDVETTGLLPKNIPDDLTAMPYIIQLSFAVYDLLNRQLIRTYDAYVKPPPHVTVSEKITEITGITQSHVEKYGQNIRDVLLEFYDAYTGVDMVVAHNLDFDSRMIFVEAKRNVSNLPSHTNPYITWMFQEKYCKLTCMELYCTMQTSIAMCSIKKTSSRGKQYNKFPKLIELYQLLFEKTPENLHNSMIDVLVCLRCFLKMKYQIHFSEKEFDLLLSKVI
jgi:DNA polymerase III epsilon subunit-like protein